jgi:hypothetical protein
MTQHLATTADRTLSMCATVVAGLIFVVGTMAPATARVEHGGEQCNGVDDNLGGLDDEGLACGCRETTSEHGSYSLCRAAVPWETAARACEAQGMALATVDSAGEDAWLQFETWWSAEGPRWWIGWNDRTFEGQGTWVDGTDASYAGWGFGQPNDWGDSDCVTLWRNGGGWYDADCSVPKGFVCERPPSSPDALAAHDD